MLSVSDEMSIKYKSGDMFDSSVEALVNTVNCVGVMGKGVALEFKRRWPANYRAYRKACDSKSLRPGKLLIVDNGGLIDNASPRWLINFPTKDHWRSKSKIEYIESGLDELVREIRRLNIKSIAMPPLGCGNGGLDWNEVRQLIDAKLKPLTEVEIEVYAPSGALESPEYVDVAERMTFGRALYLKSIEAMELRLGGSVDRLSLQKIAYLLQALGVPLNLEFGDNLYGPYSNVLKKAIIKLERWRYITRSSIADCGEEERRYRVTQPGYAAADDYLRTSGVNEVVLERLLSLISGFDNPYGLELLTTIHYQTVNSGRIKSREEATQKLFELAPYRRNVFTEDEISAAHGRLMDDGLLV